MRIGEINPTEQSTGVQAETAYRLRLKNAADLNLEIEAAKNGNDDALWTLALRYARGIGVEKNVSKALQYLNCMEKDAHCQEILRAELYLTEGRVEIARDLYYIHWNLYNDCYALYEFLKTFPERGEKIPSEYLEEAVVYCDLHDAWQLLFTADFLIEEDYAEGYYMKAQILLKNYYKDKKEKESYILGLLATAAEKGCLRALRLRCVTASKSRLSTVEKLEIFKQAAEAGEADGAYYYAELFEKETSNAQTPAESSKHGQVASVPPQELSFTRAEQAGSLPALYRLALNLRKDGVKRQQERYFQALKTVAESKMHERDFNPVAARYLLGEAYQYGIGTQKDIDTADVWYETVYQTVYPFLSWLKNQNDERERKRILSNLFAHEKRYRLCSRERSVSLPQWLKRFDQKLWLKYVAYDNRFQRGQVYIQDASKYADSEMPRAKAKALKRAVKLGNGAACDIIENYYAIDDTAHDRGRMKNLKRGVKMFNPFCMFHLGRILSRSTDFKEQAEGVRLTRLAVNRGIDLSAVKNLSLFYEHGTGVEKNAETYVKIMKQCFDADKIRHFVNPDRLLMEFCSAIGYAYFTGNGVTKDLRKTVLWFRRGADYGHAYCMRNLGWLYFDDENARESDALSRRWLERAVRKGQEFSDNIYNSLGYFYHYGVEGRQDYSIAIRYYRIAYNLFCTQDGEPENVKKAARAAYNLGVIYSQQLWDFENAILWYKKALDLKEDLSTLNNLANCYTDRDEPDFKSAEAIFNRILEIAPKHSYSVGYAYSNLAKNAIDEHCENPDYDKARALAKRSVEELEMTVKLHESGTDVKWNDSVYANLAEIYLTGVLIKRDLEKARLYAVKGAKLGHYGAINICRKHGFEYDKEKK